MGFVSAQKCFKLNGNREVPCYSSLQCHIISSFEKKFPKKNVSWKLLLNCNNFSTISLFFFFTYLS